MPTGICAKNQSYASSQKNLTNSEQILLTQKTEIQIKSDNNVINKRKTSANLVPCNNTSNSNPFFLAQPLRRICTITIFTSYPGNTNETTAKLSNAPRTQASPAW